MSPEEILSIEDADRHAVVKRRFGRGEQVIFSAFFVVFFIVANAISFAHFPGNEESMAPIVRRYAVFFGLDQWWSMFSRLRKANLHTFAVITFSDGTEKLYEYPRIDLYDQFEHFRFEKRRTMFYEFLPAPRGRKYRPAMARHLIWCNENVKNNPDIVTFVYNSVAVPPPDPKNLLSISKLPFHNNKEPYFVYRVRKSDLEDQVETK